MFFGYNTHVLGKIPSWLGVKIAPDSKTPQAFLFFFVILNPLGFIPSGRV
jgi:hypothetical protein